MASMKRPTYWRLEALSEKLGRHRILVVPAGKWETFFGELPAIHHD